VTAEAKMREAMSQKIDKPSTLSQALEFLTVTSWPIQPSFGDYDVLGTPCGCALFWTNRDQPEEHTYVRIGR